MAHHHSSSSSNAEMLRGRTRDRSSSRTASKPNRTEESSTLRGRSRQRALSPLDTGSSLSRNPSPSSLLSPTRHLLLYNQGKRRSRNHCPSRAAASPNGRRPSQRRDRRAPSARRGNPVRDPEPVRAAESFSSLRHELVVTVEAPDGSVEGVQS